MDGVAAVGCQSPFLKGQSDADLEVELEALQNELENELDAVGEGGEKADSPMASPTPPSVAPGQPNVILTPIQPDRQRESFELSCPRTEKVTPSSEARSAEPPIPPADSPSKGPGLASEEESESEQDTPIVSERTETSVPNINDPKARRPVAGELQISASAIRGRMYRIMKPTLNGKFKVSQSILDDWAKPAGTKERLRLSQIFQMCGYCPDTFVQECEVLRTELQESEVVIEGEYCSKKTLLEEWKWSPQRVSAVIKFCRTNPEKYMRRDLYEQTTLYWAEKTIRGSIRKKSSVSMNRRVQWSEQGEGSTGGAGLEPQSLSDLQTLRPNPPKQTGQAGGQEDAEMDDENDPDLHKDNTDQLRKAAGLPELPEDGLPSASATKMMSCLDKRIGKLQEGLKRYEASADLSDLQKRMVVKIQGVIKELERHHETINTDFTNGVVDGLTRQLEKKLSEHFKNAQKTAMEAVALEGRMRQLYPKDSAVRPATRPSKRAAKSKAKAKVKAKEEQTSPKKRPRKSK